MNKITEIFNDYTKSVNNAANKSNFSNDILASMWNDFKIILKTHPQYKEFKKRYKELQSNIKESDDFDRILKQLENEGY